jgi:hypothetical protein
LHSFTADILLWLRRHLFSDGETECTAQTVLMTTQSLPLQCLISGTTTTVSRHESDQPLSYSGCRRTTPAGDSSTVNNPLAIGFF